MAKKEKDKEWKAFKEEWKGFKERFIKLLESLADFEKSTFEVSQSTFKGFQLNAEVWHRFSNRFLIIIILLIITIFSKEISNLIIWIWNSLSENWRIALFQALWGLFLVIVGFFIGKKWQKSSKKGT